MKVKVALILLSLLLCIAGPCLAETVEQPADYSLIAQPAESEETLKQEVTVISYVDGDTVHFAVPQDVMADGVFKARFLGVNTPESTGRVDPWGKAAARFTKEKLSAASSILIESDTDQWNTDSTGSRYLVWVWYKTADSETYRNLNIELLQNGLARMTGANNRYHDLCSQALALAESSKLCLWSDEKDPDYSYGSAVEVTLKELRLHPDLYEGKKVAFDGVIIAGASNSVYVEAYDEETARWYGICVYYGRGFTGAGLDILNVGNEARIVGNMSYYDAGGIYEITSLTYWAMDPDHPDNLRLLAKGCTPAYPLIDALTFSGDVTIDAEEGSLTVPYAAIALHTSISMQDLTVISASMNENKNSSSYGCLTLACDCHGVPVTVYTTALYDENRTLLTDADFIEKTLTVRGFVDVHNGAYQIKVTSLNGITVQE